MLRREFTMAGLSAAALATSTAVGLAQGNDRQGLSRDRNDAHDKCAEACSDCQRECDFCVTHCADRMAEGSRQHLATLQSCRDCAEICSAAATIVAGRGPMAALICRACTDACA